MEETNNRKKQKDASGKIAVIGIGLHISCARNLKEYWDIISNKINCIEPFPEYRKELMRDMTKYYREAEEIDVEYYPGSYMEGIDEFDHEYFQMSPREASLTDPVHRLFLQTVLQAFEDAGYPDTRLKKTKTGVFVGYAASNLRDNYSTNIFLNHKNLLPYSIVGNMAPLLASRASHCLDLNGPTMILDTACSSSLVAIHEACESIRNGTCEMAIAGGAKINMFPMIDENMKIGIEAMDGKTRTFDTGAGGAANGEGVAAILLKPLEAAERDGDSVYAVIRGSAINHDGTASGITAPNPSAQTQVILEAWKNAGIDPRRIDYIESHGTATALGDPIEVQGITKAFEQFTRDRQFCAISGVKGNLGHLFECAGIVSLLKTICSLKNKKIPPTLFFREPNANINFIDSPVYVNSELKDWVKPEGEPRLCGVSAFGLSGTNCHIVLEEYIEEKEAARAIENKSAIFCLSAKSEASLKEMVLNHLHFIREKEHELEFYEYCFNTNTCRSLFEHRLCIVARNMEQLMERLETIVHNGLVCEENNNIYYNKVRKLSGDLLTRREQKKQLAEYTSRIKEAVSRWEAAGQKEAAGQREAMGQRETTGQNETAGRREVEGQREVTGQGEIMGQSEAAGQRETAGQREAMGQSEAAGQGETAGRREAMGQRETAGQNDVGIDQLKIIAEAFVNGGEIVWTQLYKDYRCRKLHLPVYPFRKERLWLPKSENTLQKSTFFYKKIWVRKPYLQEEAPLKALALITLEEGCPDQLRTCLEKKGAVITQFICDPASALIDIYKEQLLRLVQSGADIAIVVPKLFKEEVTSLEELKAFAEYTLMTVAQLAKWLTQEVPDSPVNLYLIAASSFQISGEERLLKPENSILFGFGKCVRRENRKVLFRYIDIENDKDFPDVAREMTYKDKVELAAYRNGVRYVEGLTETAMDSKEQTGQTFLKPDGVYLITGGLGGIGFEVAKAICLKEPGVSIVLVNRTPLPAEAGEESFTSDDKELEEKAARYRLLKRLAKNVMYAAADVADREAMQKIVEKAKAKLGPIKGIIHSAGLGGGAMIGDMTPDILKEKINPKIYGAWVLDSVTSGEELDFFVMFSSIATVFSSVELSAYTAGNTYLDYFADYRNRLRSGRTYTVNWATWNETGMSIKHEFTYDTLFKVISIENGIRSLFEVLSQSRSSNVIIGELNLDSNIALLLPTYPIELSDYILRRIQSLKSKDKRQDSSGIRSGEVKISGDSVYKDIELTIAKACQEVLGYDEIDINDSFFELGADSILMGRIYDLLSGEYPDKLEITDMFAYPSIRQLSEYLSSKGILSRQREDESKQRLTQNVIPRGKDIAIVGIGLTFPCANTLEEYWELISNGICAVREVPPERGRYLESHLRYNGMSIEDISFMKIAYLEEIDKFDYELFGMSPREAMLIDPINRIFLQSCWKALEDSGNAGDRLRGSNTGVFLGYTANFGNLYSRLLFDTDPALFGESLPVNQVSMAASRIAYVNDFKGPSMVIDTACSSSLVCVHMACEQIRNGNCDMALAGGVSITMLPLNSGPRVGFESAEDKTRAFSEDSNGTAVGEGAGVLLLKPLDRALEDHDHVYAVIKGSAINQDGSSFGIAAPNYLAQAEVIQRAWQSAGIEPETISYIEAHGTGTALGDPIEVRGLTQAFRNYTDKKQFCAFGSIKTNIGHLNEASGVSGLIKLILMLNHRELLPSLHFAQPNPNIDFINSPLFMVTKRQEWAAGQPVLRAGINGFGMSGTNCHIILEEPPEQGPAVDPRSPHIVVLSSQYPDGLQTICRELEQYIRDNCGSLEISGICYTLQTGRKHQSYRIAFLAEDLKDLCDKLHRISQTGWEELDAPWFCHGKYSIVSENKKERKAYEMTAEESRQLNERADDILNSVLKDYNAVNLREFIKMYVTGANYDWLRLYGEKVSKTPLPVYPFQKKHCWAEVPGQDRVMITTEEFDHLFYHMTWMEYPLGEYETDKALRSVLILCPDSTVYEATEALLRDKGIQPIGVLYGIQFKPLGENRFICENTPEDIEKLFTYLKDTKLNSIVYFTPAGDRINGYGDIQASIETGLFALMNLIKGMVKAHYNQELELVTVSYDAYGVSGREVTLSPHNAITLSVGKVIEQEYPHLSCRAIDADAGTDMGLLIDEIIQPDHRQYLVAYREGRRYAQCFGKAEVRAERNTLRRDGNYIITGGTGDIGLETALYLSQTGCGSITLLGRSGFYPREEWDRPELNEYEQKKVSILRQIESNGTRLFIATADVCDYEALKSVLERTRREAGPISGIIHSAGLAGAGYILRKENKDAQKILDPKVKGTWYLDQLTVGDDLDFLVLYSSAVTQSGEAGQSDYVAANTYLDAFCDYRNAQGKKTFTVNWVSWKETGMSVRFGINIDTITKALPTAQALEGLDLLLKSDFRRVAIGQYTIGKNMLVMDEYSRNLVSEDLRNKLKQLKELLDFDLTGDTVLTQGKREVAQIHKGKVRILPHSEKDKTSSDTMAGLKISVSANDPEEVEANLLQVYCAVLGYTEVDIYDNFFEMGGDSIILTRMQSFIDQIYPDTVNVADLFEYTSVYSLSRYIHERINELSEAAVSKEDRNQAEAQPEENRGEAKSLAEESGNAANILPEEDRNDTKTPLEERRNEAKPPAEEGRNKANILPEESRNDMKTLLEKDRNEEKTPSEEGRNEVKILSEESRNKEKILSEEDESEVKNLPKENRNLVKTLPAQWNGALGLKPYLDADTVGPLSSAQKRIYITHKRSRNKLMYNNPFACRVLSNVSRQRHEEVLRFILERHEILRTGFQLIDKTLQQRVYPEVELPIRYLSVPSLEAIDFNGLLTEFDLSKPPLFRVTIITAENSETVMFVDLHHIIADGFSSRIINRDITMAFTGQRMPHQIYQYRHYVKYEQAFMKSEAYRRMKDYWAGRLKDFTLSGYLPANNGSPDSYPLPVIRKLDNALLRDIEAMAKSCKATPFVILFSAFTILLHGYSRAGDICVGVSVMGRNDPDIMTLIGMFANILPIRTRINSGMRLMDFIYEAKKNIMMDLQNQLYPYDKMVGDYNRNSQKPSPDLINILFEYESEQMDLSFPDENELPDNDFVIPFRYSKYEVCLQILYKNGHPYIRAEYDGALYDRAYMEEFVENYTVILQKMLEERKEGTVEDYCNVSGGSGYDNPEPIL
jgi:acyl transferase domain-containing protein/acyl carrier protein